MVRRNRRCHMYRSRAHQLLFSLRFNCFIHILEQCNSYIQLRDLFIITTHRVDAVRQKDEHNIFFWIDPYTGARKTCVAKGLWRCAQCRVRIFSYRIIFLRFIKAEASSARIAVIGSEEIDRFFLYKTLAVELAAIEQHLV